MNFLLDENLSPQLRAVLNGLGYDATSVHDRGRFGMLDHEVLAWAIDEDRIIVTANGDDFRQLIGSEELHPGLWILPNVAREPAAGFLSDAVNFVEGQGESAASFMINRVVVVAGDGTITTDLLPD